MEGNHVLKSYLTLVKETLDHGKIEQTRTGVRAISVFGKSIQHDLTGNRFPLLTTKFTPLRLIASELEFFIKGITDKRWLQLRNNHIWDDWANPQIIKQKYSFAPDQLESTLNKSYKEYLQSKELIDTPRLQNLFLKVKSHFVLEDDVWKATKNISKDELPAIVDSTKKITQYIERDLGPVYGFQWRHFGADYTTYDANYDTKGYDQLKFIIETLEKEPTSRRMILSAWNPNVKNEMALEPCHYSLQVNMSDNKLNLLWSQRSVDLMLGLPFNIASYALLLNLLSKQMNLQAGKIIGQLGNVHIYENHQQGAKEQILREPKQLPQLSLEDFSDIFTWKAENIKLENYEYYPSIKFPIAV